LAEVIYKEGWMPLVLCDNEGSPLEGDGGDIMAQCPTEQQDALFTTPAHLGGSGVGNETMTAIAEQVENASFHASLSHCAMLLYRRWLSA